MMNDKTGLPEAFDPALPTDMEIALNLLGFMDDPYEPDKGQDKGNGKGNGEGNGGRSLTHKRLVKEALEGMTNPFAKDLLTRFTLADLK